MQELSNPAQRNQEDERFRTARICLRRPTRSARPTRDIHRDRPLRGAATPDQSFAAARVGPMQTCTVSTNWPAVGATTSISAVRPTFGMTHGSASRFPDTGLPAEATSLISKTSVRPMGACVSDAGRATIKQISSRTRHRSARTRKPVAENHDGLPDPTERTRQAPLPTKPEARFLRPDPRASEACRGCLQDRRHAHCAGVAGGCGGSELRSECRSSRRREHGAGGGLLCPCHLGQRTARGAGRQGGSALQG